MDWIKEELYECILIKDEKGLVCILHEDEQAKAQLISKAPEMLEMLKTLLDNSDVPNEIYDQVKQLIKEATTV